MNVLDWIIGGTAASCACLFTNPFEVVKARLQLQGEMKPRGTYPIYYKSTFKGLRTIVQHEGYRALYKGIIPALWFQFIYHGIRLGSISTADQYGFLRDSPKSRVELLPSVLVASIGGTIGTMCASPFQLIKVQMQSQCSPNIAVGHQHHLTGMLSGLRNIVKEQGVFGLYSGLTASIPRTVLGSGIQIASYAEWKYFLIDKKLLPDSSMLTTFITINISGIFLTLVLSPFDVGVTRLYNQALDKAGNGILYDNLFDCFAKMYRNEGIMGFYKGSFPCYLRIGPHTSIVILFYEWLKYIKDVHPHL